MLISQKAADALQDVVPAFYEALIKAFQSGCSLVDVEGIVRDADIAPIVRDAALLALPWLQAEFGQPLKAPNRYHCERCCEEREFRKALDDLHCISCGWRLL